MRSKCLVFWFDEWLKQLTDKQKSHSINFPVPQGWRSSCGYDVVKGRISSAYWDLLNTSSEVQNNEYENGIRRSLHINMLLHIFFLSSLLKNQIEDEIDWRDLFFLQICKLVMMERKAKAVSHSIFSNSKWGHNCWTQAFTDLIYNQD